MSIKTAPMQKQMQVFSTMDYSKFSFLDGNRSVNELHLKRLKKSMNEKYLLSPITVNENMEVIDGQHRLQCAVELGKPVYYIICPGYGLNEIHRYNSNAKNWTINDFVEGYIELGYQDYVKYKAFKDRYGFGHNETMAMLSWDNGTNGYEKFNAGEFKVKNYARACEYADKITMIAPYYTGYKRRSFVYAMLYILKNKEFDMDTLLQKIKYQQTKLVDCVDTKTYVNLLDEIYNYKARKIVSLR